VQIDIVENSVGVHPAAPAAPFLLRLTQGVADTATEAVLLDSPDVTNTSELFERDRAVGKEWLLVTDVAMANRLPLAAVDRQRIVAAITNGDVALLRPESVVGGGREDAVWWRVDASTGATLGIGPDGAGATISEHVALVVNLAIRLGGIMVCAHKTFQAADEARQQPKITAATTRRLVAGFACIIGASISAFAKFDKFMPPPSLSSAANQWVDDVGSLIGLGGGIVVW
jgi:hypothetical protein